MHDQRTYATLLALDEGRLITAEATASRSRSVIARISVEVDAGLSG
jgi:hypothetical protein